MSIRVVTILLLLLLCLSIAPFHSQHFEMRRVLQTGSEQVLFADWVNNYSSNSSNTDVVAAFNVTANGAVNSTVAANANSNPSNGSDTGSDSNIQANYANGMPPPWSAPEPGDDEAFTYSPSPSMAPPDDDAGTNPPTAPLIPAHGLPYSNRKLDSDDDSFWDASGSAQYEGGSNGSSGLRNATNGAPATQSGYNYGSGTYNNDDESEDEDYKYYEGGKTPPPNSPLLSNADLEHDDCDDDILPSTRSPSPQPSLPPSTRPSVEPGHPTPSPTSSPSPTVSPSAKPSALPTVPPTGIPTTTRRPSTLASSSPSQRPSADIRRFRFFCNVSWAVPSLERRNLHEGFYFRVFSSTMHALIEESTPYHVKDNRLLLPGPPIRKRMQLNENVSQSQIAIVETSIKGTWWTCSMAYDAWTIEPDAIIIELDLTKCLNDSLTSGLFLSRVQEKAPEIMVVTNARWASENSLHSVPAFQLDWEVQQWIGLGILSVTISFVAMLSSTAVYRRNRQEEEHWGVRLGTDRGVEEMLDIGWDGQKAYRKEEVGYRDDDSVFIGGFEHTERALMSSATTTSSNEHTQTALMSSTTTMSSSRKLIVKPQ